MRTIIKKILIAILTLEARVALLRWKPKIVAVTGSVGKTSTKDAVYTIFSKLSSAVKSQKSFNSEIGVPLSILGLDNPWLSPYRWLVTLSVGLWIAFFARRRAEWFVLEVGADRKGDIEKITKWLKPDIAVISKIGHLPVHVEYFSSPDEVAREKAFLAKAVKRSGTVVVYADDNQSLSIANDVRRKIQTYGFSENSDVKASNYIISYLANAGTSRVGGISFKVNFEGKSFPVRVDGVLGKQHVYGALGAISVALCAGFNALSAIEALSAHVSPNGRMKLVEGIKNSTIIDDTYNSSPSALAEALSTLGEVIQKGRKIAVLGDMRELGKYSLSAHLEAGRLVAKVAEYLVTVGESGKLIARGALEEGFPEDRVFQFETSESAGLKMQDLIQEGDMVLVKGSQGVRMEKVVLEIMAYPEKSKDLLVRQEDEWILR